MTGHQLQEQQPQESSNQLSDISSVRRCQSSYDEVSSNAESEFRKTIASVDDELKQLIESGSHTTE